MDTLTIGLTTILLCLVNCSGQLWQEEDSDSTSNGKGDLLVQTQFGLVRGKYGYTPDGVKTRAFLGLRYAQPPTGKLRFQLPKPVNSSQEGSYTQDRSLGFNISLNSSESLDAHTGDSQIIVNATEFGNICMQGRPTISTSESNRRNFTQSEDCLYLNIYTPVQVAFTSSNISRAVIVYIHGGEFSDLSGSHFSGDRIALHGGVIIVTINYRLGVFGFIESTEELVDRQDQSILSPNLGVHDQILALRWVRQHISAFGGNPDRVTLFGQGSGAICASIHAVSPLSAGLFIRVILSNGNLFSPSALSTESGLSTSTVVQRTGCLSQPTTRIEFNSTGDKLLSCLQNLTAPELQALSVGLAWNPVVDGSVLTESPQSLRYNTYFGSVSEPLRLFQSYDLLIGLNSFSGSTFFPVYDNIYRELTNQSIPASGIDDMTFRYMVDRVLVRPYLVEDPYYMRELIVQLITDTYTKRRIMSNSNLLRKLIELTGDMMHLASTKELARMHRDLNSGKTTYLYYFDQQKQLQDLFYHMPHPLLVDQGAGLNSELPYIFGDVLSMRKFDGGMLEGVSASDQDLSFNMIRTISVFAKSGNLKLPRVNHWRRWKPFSEKEDYFHMTTGSETSEYQADGNGNVVTSQTNQFAEGVLKKHLRSVEDSLWSNLFSSVHDISISPQYQRNRQIGIDLHPLPTGNGNVAMADTVANRSSARVAKPSISVSAKPENYECVKLKDLSSSSHQYPPHFVFLFFGCKVCFMMQYFVSTW